MGQGAAAGSAGHHSGHVGTMCIAARLKVQVSGAVCIILAQQRLDHVMVGRLMSGREVGAQSTELVQRG